MNPLLTKIKIFFSGTRIIVFGFLFAVILGTILLKLPFAHHGQLAWADSLFVAASSVCVTGLSTVNIGLTFTTAGHIIILLLIQVGGLGFITFSTLILLLLGKRLSLRNKLIIQSAYNVSTTKGLAQMTKNIFKATFLLEGLGAIGYAFVFIPLFGLKGVWYSVFHSVSAFCNAGIDLLGGDSFTAYRNNVMLNLVTIFLIIVSGIGFPVYWEIIRLTKNKIHHITNDRRANTQLKIVAVMTAMLIITGTVATLVFEWNNENTIGGLPLGRKILDSLFQSVTLRTAGFATIPQGNFTPASAITYLLFMFIGGSPAGTAGGIKTVTFAVVAASLISNIRQQDDVNIFRRRIPDSVVKQCTAIVFFSFSVLVIGTTALLYVQKLDFLDALYEMTSAIATVGLSRGITADLCTTAKIIVTITMYLGRIGPISLALSFNGKVRQADAQRAQTDISFG